MTATGDMLHGVYLRFFTHADARHDGRLLHEWLLELARREGIGGGSAFRAVAGYGRHGVLREETFFELAGNLPVKVEFILGREQADRLIAAVRAAAPQLVYAQSPVEYGVLGEDVPGTGDRP